MPVPDAVGVVFCQPLFHFGLARTPQAGMMGSMNSFRWMPGTAFFVMLVCLFFSGCESKEDQLIKQREKRTKKIDGASREAMKKSYEDIQDYNREERTKAIRSEFEDEIERIETRYRLEKEDVERQIQRRREERARY